MSDPAELDFELRQAVGEPRGAVVLLHGRGADAHDLQPLLELLDPQRQLVGVTPQGPLCLPPGGRHWYVVQRVGYPQAQTFTDSYASLGRWLEALPQLTGVPLRRTVLGGFSQGAVMAYALGLGHGRPSPAAIIALSGFIPTVAGFQLDAAAHREVPVAIAHGTLDPVIPVEFARRAHAQLTAAGLRVELRESLIGHTIDPGVLAELQRWLYGVTGMLAVT